MPRIRYTDGPDEVTVTPAGKPTFVATRGEWAETDAATAKSLEAQGWERESETPKKAAAKRADSERE